MSDPLTLRPLLVFERADGFDFFLHAPHPSEQFAIPSVPGYVYGGIAFMVSSAPATLPDGTALIPFHERIFPDGQHFYSTIVPEPGEPPGTVAGATYYVLPNGTTDYGARPIRRYCHDPQIVHYYSTDVAPVPPSAWRREGDMGCAVPVARVHVGLQNGVVSTSTTVVVDGTAQRLEDADVFIYPSRGSMIVIERTAPGYELDTLTIRRVDTGEEWTFGLREVSQAPGCPFRVVGTWQDGEGAYIVDEHDEGLSEDVTYEYTVAVRQGREVYSHDPKVINRSGTTTAPISHR